MQSARFILILGVILSFVGKALPETPDLMILVLGGENTPEVIQVMFNPSEISLSRSVAYEPGSARSNTQQQKFLGLEEATLHLELTFDTTGSLSDVREFSSPITQLAEIPAGEKRPPVCQFIWGSGLNFTGVVAQVHTTFTMFRADGTPLRAKVNLTILESLPERRSSDR